MRRSDLFLLGSLGILGVLVMLPRILSAQFGLLDDAVLLLNAQLFLDDVSYAWYQFQRAGRFLPTVTLVRGIIFAWAGFDPQSWYLVMTFMLIVICFMLYCIVRSYRFHRVQAVLTVLFFVASPSLIESFYTLSKSEVYLLLFVASAILFALVYPSWRGKAARVLLAALIFLLLLLGFGTKETTLVLPLLFFAWYLFSRAYSRKYEGFHEFVQSDGILLGASLISCLVYWSLRSYVGIGSSSAYSANYQLFDLEKILFNFKAFLGWVMRDYLYLLLAGIALLAMRSLRDVRTTFFAARWLIWVGAWAGILLPWNYVAYYLLPFSFGSAVFSGVILGRMLTFLQPEVLSKTNPDARPRPIRSGAAHRTALAAFCIIALLSILPSAFNAAAYGTEQLMYDRANWQFLEQLTRLPKNSRLFLNLPPHHEYFIETKRYARSILNRGDLRIEALQPPMTLTAGPAVYVASPVFPSQVLPQVRALNSPDIVESRRHLGALFQNSKLIYSDTIKRPLIDIGFHRLLSSLRIGDMIGFSKRTVFVFTTLEYGWEIWKYPTSR